MKLKTPFAKKAHFVLREDDRAAKILVGEFDSLPGRDMVLTSTFVHSGSWNLTSRNCYNMYFVSNVASYVADALDEAEFKISTSEACIGCCGESIDLIAEDMSMLPIVWLPNTPKIKMGDWI